MKFAVAALLAALVSAGAPVVQKKGLVGLKGKGRLESSRPPVLGAQSLAHGDKLGLGLGIKAASKSGPQAAVEHAYGVEGNRVLRPGGRRGLVGSGLVGAGRIDGRGIIGAGLGGAGFGGRGIIGAGLGGRGINAGVVAGEPAISGAAVAGLDQPRRIGSGILDVRGRSGIGRIGPAVNRVGRVDDYGAGIGRQIGFGRSYTRGLGIQNNAVGVAGQVTFDQTDVGALGGYGVSGASLGGAAQSRHGYGRVGYSMGPTGMTAQLGNFQKSGYQYDIDDYGTKGASFGLNGINRLTGLKGLRGVNNRLGGVQSLGGIRGLKGLQGLQGVNNNLNRIQSLGGVQGLNGLDGLDNRLGGIQSLGGVQGLQGLRGLQGVNNRLGGINSLNGIQGLNGVQQLDGLDNRLGISSLQGIESMQGLQGLNGIRGETFDTQGYGEDFKAYGGVGYGSDRVGYGGQHGFDYNLGVYGGYGVNSNGSLAGQGGLTGVTGVTGPAIGAGLTQVSALGGLTGVTGGISRSQGAGLLQGRGGAQDLTQVQGVPLTGVRDQDNRATQGGVVSYGVSASQGGVSRTYDSAPNYRGFGPNYAQRVGSKNGLVSNVGFSRSSVGGFSSGSPIPRAYGASKGYGGYGGYGQGLY